MSIRLTVIKIRWKNVSRRNKRSQETGHLMSINCCVCFLGKNIRYWNLCFYSLIISLKNIIVDLSLSLQVKVGVSLDSSFRLLLENLFIFLFLNLCQLRFIYKILLKVSICPILNVLCFLFYIVFDRFSIC